jgi:hypothetical protein
LDPFSLTTVEAGTSKSKFLRQKMIRQLWNLETFQAHQAEYEANREAKTKKASDDNQLLKPQR